VELMDSVDKTYTNSYDEYKAFCKWAKSRRKKFKVKCRRCGVYSPNEWTIMNCVYPLKKANFDGIREVPIMNTPEIIDRYLIKYCPFEFVQKRMKDVYTKEYYDKYANPPSVCCDGWEK
jgi:hypothetical protein